MNEREAWYEKNNLLWLKVILLIVIPPAYAIGWVVNKLMPEERLETRTL